MYCIYLFVCLLTLAIAESSGGFLTVHPGSRELVAAVPGGSAPLPGCHHGQFAHVQKRCAHRFIVVNR